ncbi:MAG: hypothetical protein ACXITV_03680 [Luteibaculaceae bacterium]
MIENLVNGNKQNLGIAHGFNRGLLRVQPWAIEGLTVGYNKGSNRGLENLRNGELFSALV